MDGVVELFRDAPFRWWLSGGHALEAHLGESWRSHDDTDVGIVRTDAARLLDVLPDWDVRVGAAGTLRPWSGEPLDPTRSENNLWCRASSDSPWALDVTVGAGNEREWIYRRDRSIRRPWADAVLTTSDGIPYLAPELQLLFKSRTIRPKDDHDARFVIPRLARHRRAWLSTHLPTDHPWQPLCGLRDD